jgi:hypothetical protein
VVWVLKHYYNVVWVLKHYYNVVWVLKHYYILLRYGFFIDSVFCVCMCVCVCVCDDVTYLVGNNNSSITNCILYLTKKSNQSEDGS